MSATRQTFAGLSQADIAVWYVLVAVSTGVFVWGAARLVVKYRLGRRLRPHELNLHGLAAAARGILSHRRIARRDPVAGIGHALVFYGFGLLFMGTTILAFQADFMKPLFDVTFWHGWFYKIYSLTLDLAGVALLLGLGILSVKRAVQRPPRLDYDRPDRAENRRAYEIGDWAFLSALFFLAATGLVLESLRLTQSAPSFEVWSPVGWAGADALQGLGMGPDAASTAHLALWWIHGIAALTFVAAIPFTKGVHMMSSPANVSLRDDRAGIELPPMPLDAATGDVGYAKVTDLGWQHLLSLDACTKCGKCHVACPATAAGYPLSPRDLILDLREFAEGSIGLRSTLHLQPLHNTDAPLVPDAVRPEALWSCMQCMACVEICPVGIEHVPIINEMRRSLVESGEVEPMLQTTFESVHSNGNSFGEPRRKRARWTRTLNFDIKDARTERVEALWFVGDYASYDPRNQRCTRALATILHHAEVDFGILYDAEKTGGCDIRRAGEEGLWASLADENIELLKTCEFDRVFSSDPHTFHTLRNEYPARGGEWPVFHHSQLLLELLDTGKIEPRRMLGYRVTYHDPCTLGRYNGVYDPPREVLRRIGCDLVEMPRSRDNSFCCGAGGGRIWMKELSAGGTPRPSEQRIHEAAAIPALERFVVACPKDVTMYEDAIKTVGPSVFALRELSELVLESLALPDAQQPPGTEAATLGG